MKTNGVLGQDVRDQLIGHLRDVIRKLELVGEGADVNVTREPVYEDSHLVPGRKVLKTDVVTIRIEYT